VGLALGLPFLTPAAEILLQLGLIWRIARRDLRGYWERLTPTGAGL